MFASRMAERCAARRRQILPSASRHGTPGRRREDMPRDKFPSVEALRLLARPGAAVASGLQMHSGPG